APPRPRRGRAARRRHVRSRAHPRLLAEPVLPVDREDRPGALRAGGHAGRRAARRGVRGGADAHAPPAGDDRPRDRARAHPRTAHLDLRLDRRNRDRSRIEPGDEGASGPGGIPDGVAGPRRLLLAGLLTLALLPGAASAATRTYSTGPLAFAIPDVGTVDVPLAVPDKGPVSYLEVGLR